MYYTSNIVYTLRAKHYSVIKFLIWNSIAQYRPFWLARKKATFDEREDDFWGARR